MSLLHCGAKLSWCQIVLFSLRCQIVLFPLRCQIVLVPNCPILHSWCQIVLGAKLSSFTLLVPNCPFYTAVPNCPRCQIVPQSVKPQKRAAYCQGRVEICHHDQILLELILIDCGKLYRKFKGVPLYQNLLRLSERRDPAPAGSKGLLGQTPSAAGSCC